jgi:LCP family protein required for cell wall assembly
VICLFALLAGTVEGWSGGSKLTHTMILNTLGLSREDPSSVFKTHMFTILLLGCDEDRTTGGAKITESKARSDMMLLAQVDFDKKLVTGLSIPRDLLVGFGKYHERKINAYHAIGGNDLAKQAVEALLPGVQVDRVVDLNFEGFQDMVNAVGGVPIRVEKNMNYDDDAGHLHIHLHKGEQVLDGVNAMGYVRFRHSDSDFARTDRQHNFMLAFKGQAAENWRTLPHVLDGVGKMLSNGMTTDEVASLGMFVKDLPKDRIKFGALPVIEVEHYNLRLQESEVPKLLRDYNLLEGAQAANNTP